MRKSLVWKSKSRAKPAVVPVATQADRVVSAATSERHHWVWFAAQCAQVAGVMVAIIGYFMTVLPVLQKERLEEQAASLEKQNELAQAALATTIAQKDRASTDAALLLARVEDLDAELDSLALRERNATERTQAAERAANIAKLNAANAVSYASAAKEQLSAYLMQTLSGATPPTLNVQKISSKVMRPDPFLSESDSIASDLEEGYLDPFELAKTGVANAKRWADESPDDISKPVLADLAKQLEEGLAKHKASLTCPSIDFNAWESRFKAAQLELGSLISGCTEKYWQRVASRESWSDRKFRIERNSALGAHFQAHLHEICEISADGRLRQAFFNAYQKAIGPCVVRAMTAEYIALNGAMDDLPPFVATAPPSVQTMVGEIRGWSPTETIRFE